MDNPLQLAGIPVTISQPVKVRRDVIRSWRERLLTLPWKPWDKVKVEYHLVDTLQDGTILRFDYGLLMNEATWCRCSAALYRGA